MKTLTQFMVIALMLGACATPPPKARPPHANVRPPVEPTSPMVTFTPSQPAPANPSDAKVADAAPATPPETPPAAVVEPIPEAEKKPAARRTLGVWIDGAGFDATAALGFLQELEKQGIKPSKVVGTGFGCWVALSWAFSNSGNRAEWQTFKWSNFDLLKREGLLGKLTGGAGLQSRFEGEVVKLFPNKNFSGLSVPADCPVVSSKTPYTFESGHNIDIPALLWLQLQAPVLGAPDAELGKSGFYSGLLGGLPYEAELDAFSKDVPHDASGGVFGAWLVLRTRGSKDRSGEQNWSRGLSGRTDESFGVAGRTKNGVTWTVVNLDDAGGHGFDEISKPENRRRWLLEGRKRAQQMLQKNEIKNFLESSAPN